MRLPPNGTTVSTVKPGRSSLAYCSTSAFASSWVICAGAWVWAAAAMPGQPPGTAAPPIMPGPIMEPGPMPMRPGPMYAKAAPASSTIETTATAALKSRFIVYYLLSESLLTLERRTGRASRGRAPESPEVRHFRGHDVRLEKADRRDCRSVSTTPSRARTLQCSTDRGESRIVARNHSRLTEREAEKQAVM